MSLFQVSSEKIKPMLEVRKEYLEDVYREIIKQYGDIENYLYEGCGIKKECLSKLKNMLLE